MGYLVEQNGRSYDEGVAAGEIAQRLKGHDEHFGKINGSIKDLATEMGKLALQNQRIADAMDADRATVITTAKALKDAKDAGEQRWSPLGRFAAVFAIMASLVAILLYIQSILH